MGWAVPSEHVLSSVLHLHDESLFQPQQIEHFLYISKQEKKASRQTVSVKVKVTI